MIRRVNNREITVVNKGRINASVWALRHRCALLRVTVAVVCGFVASLALATIPAGAKVIHLSEGSFNGSDRPTFGAFAYFLPSVAAEESSGDIWVTESEFLGAYGKAYAVDKFNAKGEYAGVQLTGQGTPQSEFSFGPSFAPGVAVDNTASGPRQGALYVSDTGHGVVDRFNSSGTFECQITGKTPSTVEEQAHECNGAAGSLTPEGSIEPTGIAVDSAGNVYVADHAHNVIDVFGPSGEYKTQVTDSSHLGTGRGLGTIALDSAGNLYVTNVSSEVVKFDAGGNFVSIVAEGSVWGVAVDSANNHAYVGLVQNPGAENETRVVTEYEPSGIALDSFASSSTEGIGVSYLGIAVGAAGKVYVAEPLVFSHGANVNIYSHDTVIPNVTTAAATSVEESTATLHGHIDPDAANGGGEVTSCQFEYGPTKGYGETAPCTPAPPYSSPQDVTASVTSLRPSTTYHFRLQAANGNGVSSYGEDETMTTKGPPSIDNEAAEALTKTVNFRAKIDPWGYDTTCQLQYVTDASFQQSQWANATTTPCSPEDIGSGFGDVTVKLELSELERATVYHFRFLATNQAGLSGHPGGTFETYGIRDYSLEARNSAGEPETQAGAHPYEVVTNLELSETTQFGALTSDPPVETEKVNFTGVNTKDIKVALPPGLIGNPNVGKPIEGRYPKCNRYLVNQEACPGDTQVGTLELWLDKYISGPSEVSPLPSERAPSYDVPLFNLEPSGRYPAEFGAFVEGQAGAWIGFHVRTGSDYGVSADSLDLVSTGVPERVRVHVWGVPADPTHNSERSCPVSGGYATGDKCPPEAEPLKPLLTNPTSCAGTQASTASVDSWQEPGLYVTKTAQLPGFTGCGKIPFEPTFEAQETTNTADSPSGLHVDLHVPQPEGCKEEAGKVVCEDAEADLKNAAVTLPAGVTVDPSSADGLAACSEEQIGYLPQRSAEVGHPQFTSDAAQCPDASKIGSVEVDTPLLEHALHGAVYVAAQGANPFKSMLALYIAIYDPQIGVVVKLPGKVTADPATGQLRTTFDDNPQLPFEDFKLDFFEGSRATLTTPLLCGSYATATDLTPWSAPEGKNALMSSKAFSVTGPNGGPCASTEGQAPNSPGFEAGTASPVAGSFSPFVLHLKRDDGSQHFSGLNVTLPPGLTGKIAGLEQCPQAGIDAAMARSHEGEGGSELAHPSCPPGSEVGVVHVGAGSGAPFYTTGHAYFAGPYRGAPFSLVIVTPAVAGPFDLGTVVVRAALFIDPYTAQVTVKSDPFPTILDGIPLDVRSVNVDMNRGEFTLNPTNCSPMSVSGQETSTAGQTAALSDRFQAGGCTTLPFHPVFSASTRGATSRKNGASLTVRVASSTGQANIAKVHATLPKQLPSRLDTLKLACTERVFAADPASCPAASAVGRAVAHTPVLNSPLIGPAYIVSHGGAAFPDLEVVLQGEGVTIVLDGKTNIRNGITESTFESIPDAPVSSFELNLPEGAHSILSAPGGGLCSLARGNVLVKRKVTVKVRVHGHLLRRRVTRTVKKRVAAGLVMPTAIQGQNGAVIHQRTAIGVTGCGRAAAAKATRHAKHRKRKHG